MQQRGWHAYDLSKHAGMGHSLIGRWAAGSAVSVEGARKVAAAFRRPVLEAFIAAGFLTAEEARVKEIPGPAALDAVPHAALLAELNRRLVEGEDGTVKPMRPKRGGKPRADDTAEGQDWAARRRPGKGGDGPPG